MYTLGTLGTQNPKSLQAKVFFEVTLHFGRGGWEGWHERMKQSFEIHNDASGREFVTVIHNELDKNHRSDEWKHQN